MLLDIFKPTEFWGEKGPLHGENSFAPHTTHTLNEKHPSVLGLGCRRSTTWPLVRVNRTVSSSLSIYSVLDPRSILSERTENRSTENRWLFLDCGLIDRNVSLQSTSLRTLTGTTTRTVSRSHVVHKQFCKLSVPYFLTFECPRERLLPNRLVEPDPYSPQ